jgi:hypothetical protein
VPHSPPRIAPASPVRSSEGNIGSGEVVRAPPGSARPAATQDRPPDVPAARASASAALAERGRPPPNASAEPLDFDARIRVIVDEADRLRAQRALDARIAPQHKAIIDDLFRGHPDQPPSIRADPLFHRDPDDEIVPRSPMQQVGTARRWSEVDPGTGSTGQHQRRAVGPTTETTVVPADSRPQAPEPSEVQALVERATRATSWKASKNLGKVLTSVNHPGIHDSMRFPLADLVCREWNEAFGPQSQLVAPLWPTIKDPAVRVRLQAAYVSNRLIEEDRLPKLPPTLSKTGQLPDATEALRDWGGKLTHARTALALVCAAKANGMTDADAISLTSEPSSGPAQKFMGRVARAGASNLALIDEIYELKPFSTESVRSTPGLWWNQALRSAFVKAMEKFEKMQSDSTPAGLAARAELRTALPASLESALSGSQDSTKLELATLLMHAATAGPQALQRVCTCLIEASDDTGNEIAVYSSLGKQGPRLAELHKRLQEPVAR